MSHDTLSTRTAVVLLWVTASMLALNHVDIAAAPDEESLRIRTLPSSIQVLRGSREVLAYRRGDVEFKPYIERLVSPKGVNVLLDSPADHQHHHGLMLALGVDDTDFWSERLAQAPGRQRERSTDIVSRAPAQGAAAAFAEELDWVDVAGGKVVLTEERAIRVTVGEGDATLLSWTSALSLPEGKRSAKLWGRHYFGLGLRFVRSMDATGQFTNSAGKEGKVVRGDERLTRAKWCSCTALVDGRPVTVAMFDHPENPRHPAAWFTMAKPFAYMTATLNLEEEPLILEGTRPLRLRYGVALWDGRKDASRIEELYRKWVDRSETRRPSGEGKKIKDTD